MPSPYNFEDCYPELVNKLRWAICSTFKTRESNYPYGAGQALATVFSQSIVEIVKLAVEEPGVVGSPSTVRNFFQTQELLTKT